MPFLFKTIFDFLTDKLGLPVPWYWELLILFAIGLIAYYVAFDCVGVLYRFDLIDGKNMGSFFHWAIRLAVFFALWAIIVGVIWLVRFVIRNWVYILSCLGGVLVLGGIITAVILSHRKKGRNA